MCRTQCVSSRQSSAPHGDALVYPGGTCTGCSSALNNGVFEGMSCETQTGRLYTHRLYSHAFLTELHLQLQMQST
eukprot:4144045-Pyramimonas_sp.AAC.2